jgi:hypothetical protein
MRTILLAALLSAHVNAPAKEQLRWCPLGLPGAAVTINVPGWTGYAPPLMRLTGYGMMLGPPESMTYLIGEGTSRRKGRSVSVWRFNPGEEKWLYCTYDRSGAIQISKRLEDSATECELSHRPDKYGHFTDMVVACRVK